MEIKVFPKIVKIRGLNNKDVLLAYLCKKDDNNIKGTDSRISKGRK